MDKRTYLSYKSEMFAHTAAKRRIANVMAACGAFTQRFARNFV